MGTSAGLSTLNSQLSTALWELEELELIYQERSVPEEEYSFQHVLIQDTIYRSLLRRHRALLHQQAGEAIERLYPEQLEEHYELLAFHYSRSNDTHKAIQYLFWAAQQAAARYANQEALDYYEQALWLSEGSDDHDTVLAHRAKLLLDCYQGKAAVTDYEQLLQRARLNQDRKRELESLLGLAAAHCVIAWDDASFAARSRKLYEDAYTLARELGDKSGMIRALIPTTTLQSFWSGEIRDQAMADAKEAAALSREIGDEALTIDSKLAVLHHTRCTHPREAEEQAEALLHRIKARHDLLKLKELYWHLISVHTDRANYARAVELCDSSIRLCEKLGVSPVQYPTFKAIALLNRGCYHDAWEALQAEVADDAHPFGTAMKELGTSLYFLELLAYDKATTVSRSVIEQANQLRRPWMRRWAQSVLAKSLLRSGRRDDADLNSMFQEHQSGKDVFAYPAEVMAEIHLAQDRLDQALQQSEEASSQAEAVGFRLGYLAAAELRLRILLRRDRPEDVMALAAEALPVAQETRSLPMIWRIRASRAQALSLLGTGAKRRQGAAAAQEYSAAAAVIHKLAHAIGDPELRQGFMADPRVSSVLAASNELTDSHKE
jgi:hypothetical protein